MNIIYIISLIILLVVLVVIYNYAKFVLTCWHEAKSPTSKVLSILGIITFTVVVICWLFLTYWTIDCWYVSNFTTRPKPHFLVMYVLGFFMLGISMGLTQLLLGFGSFKKDKDSSSLENR